MRFPFEFQTLSRIGLYAACSIFCAFSPGARAAAEAGGVHPPSQTTVSGSEAARSSSSAAIRKLKAAAGTLYRGKRYEEAGRLYQEAAALDTLDAAIRNDLAHCFLKRGMKDSAFAATREALGLADRGLSFWDTAAWSTRDLRTRKSAYFNLDRLGKPMIAPLEGECESWTASQCGGRLHVCLQSGRRSIPGGILHWDVLRLGVTRARAQFTSEESETTASAPRPEMRDMEEMSVEGLPESRMRWVNRDSAATLTLEERVETSDPGCPGDCGGPEKVRTECRVVHFDPCAGVVGVACTLEGEGGSDRIQIGEYYLVPVK